MMKMKTTWDIRTHFTGGMKLVVGTENEERQTDRQRQPGVGVGTWSVMVCAKMAVKDDTGGKCKIMLESDDATQLK